MHKLRTIFQGRAWRAGTLQYSAGGLAVLFGWLLCGDFAWTLKERAIVPVSQVMLRGLTAPDWVIGLLVGSIPAALALALGPLISLKSDAYRSRWGRRIPFMVAAIPLGILTMLGLAATTYVGEWLHHTLGGRSPGLLACRVTVFAVFWTLYECASITVGSLFDALINDVVPAELMGRFLSLFRGVSLLAGIVFNFYVIGFANDHAAVILIGLAVLAGIGFTAMCLKVKEGAYPPPPPRETGRAAGLRLAKIGRYFRECFADPFYLCFYSAYALGYASVAPVNTFSIFHARSVGLTDAEYGKSVALSYVISLVMAYPLGILADRVHPVRIGLATMLAYLVISVAGFFLAVTPTAFFVIFVLHSVAGGVFGTGAASIAQRMLPRGKFAQYFSATNLVRSVVFMVIPPVLGLAIGRWDHDYRYAFLFGTAVAAAAAVAFALLLARYQRLGGDTRFAPPVDRTD